MSGLGLACAALVGAAATDFETNLIAWGVARHGRELEPDPAGKVIEEVLIASQDIFVAGDVWPQKLNLAHVRTKDHVIAREVLLEPGDTWDPARVIETERIMRSLTLWSIVRVVPVKGRDGGVGLLVVAQDRWSLRLNGVYQLVGDLLQYLRLQPTEANVFGRGKSFSLELELKLDNFTVSQRYVDPRLFGTYLRLAESFGLVLNRSSLAVEGFVGALEVGRPLVTLDDRWSYLHRFTLAVMPIRTFRGPTVWQLESPYGPVPFVYDSAVGDGEVTVARRFGQEWKLSLQGGVKGYARRYRAPGSLGAEQARWLTEGWLPRSEIAAGLIARAELFKNEFTVVYDVESIGLSEDVQLGPRLFLGAFWSAPLPFVSVRYLEASASARWRWLFAGNLLTAQGAAFARFTAEGEPVNRRYAVELVNASPRIGGGRFFARVLLDVRQADLNQRRQLLGGGNGLRGAPPELQAGRHLVLGNFEYRTAPVAYGTVRIGGATFYDVGSAFDDRPWLTHTLGAGLRIAFPQFGPEVLRVDLGFIAGGQGFPGGMLTFSNVSSAYGQITDFRPAQFFDAPL